LIEFRTLRRTLINATTVLLLAAVWAGSGCAASKKKEPKLSPELTFLHGSIMRGPAFPEPLWNVLPTLFPEKLPSGSNLSAFGMLTNPASNGQWVGLGRSDRLFPSVTLNCALCHAGTFRRTPESPRELVPGMPAHTLDFEALQQFVVDSLKDPRFRTRDVVAAMHRQSALSWFDRQRYRFLIVPLVRKKFVEQGAQIARMTNRPVAGPGRADAFNRLKVLQFNIPFDDTIGTSDYPPLWNQEARAGDWLHWNGSGNNLLQENLLSARAFLNGPSGLDQPIFAAVTNYLRTLKPPPFPGAIDSQRAARGEKLYQQNCADCHARSGSRTGQVTPLDEIGTDPYFLKMWNEPFVSRIQSYHRGPFHFDSVRITNGYANFLLDGVWARAPYLHNGSVPTLWHLLQDPAQRPATFHRGYDVVDNRNVGFISFGPVAVEEGFLYDTHLPGNSNRGHDYGSALPDSDKWDLIEYLKTL
jgi:hypothetical protein